MKYFIDITVIDKLTNNVKQKFTYDVNSETSVTLESAKTELLDHIKVPVDYILTNEKLTIGKSVTDLTAVIEHMQKVTYKAYIQSLPKEQK